MSHVSSPPSHTPAFSLNAYNAICQVIQVIQCGRLDCEIKDVLKHPLQKSCEFHFYMILFVYSIVLSCYIYIIFGLFLKGSLVQITKNLYIYIIFGLFSKRKFMCVYIYIYIYTQVLVI